MHASPKVKETHTLTATIIEELSGSVTGVPGENMSFTVLPGGPHAGLTYMAVTDANGGATWPMIGTDDGLDTIEACFNDDGTIKCSNAVEVDWLAPCNITLGPGYLELIVGNPYTASARRVTMDHDGSPVDMK
jgi:hypothetical protein